MVYGNSSTAIPEKKIIQLLIAALVSVWYMYIHEKGKPHIHTLTNA